MNSDDLRNIPSVSRLLESPTLRSLIDRVGHHAVVGGVRQKIEEIRERVQQASETYVPVLNELADEIAESIRRETQPSLRPTINATGILLHTGLGRAPLANVAIEAMRSVAGDYASVELDLASGKRSKRVVAVEGLLQELCNAEAACVVNNNAGATMLALAAVAGGREVIVSRGQLIEIGGSYRLPDVMSTSGAVLHEVGTTNRTHLDDYRKAINENTAALLLVHPSNFVVEGFTKSVELRELVALGKEHNLPVIHDIGSGALLDMSAFGFRDEPVAQESIRQGADLVLFSGDKLLGGPQCGIAIGRRAWVDKLAKHPMARALRVDKLTLAALAATLRLYRQEDIARREIPLLALLSASEEALEARAKELAERVNACDGAPEAEAVSDVSYLGGGSIPTQQMATWCVSIQAEGGQADRLATALRVGAPSVVGRVQQGRLMLDLRSVFPRQDAELLRAIKQMAEPQTD